MLFINYKAIDTIGHIFSLNSPEMRDTVSWQDAALKTLIDFLNQQVGAGKWAMVLTADHGHQYSPTVSGAFQIDVNRLAFRPDIGLAARRALEPHRLAAVAALRARRLRLQRSRQRVGVVLQHDDFLNST